MTAAIARKGEFALPKSARHAYCRSCGKSIAWIKTERGWRMPLDLSTVVERDGERFALNHFSTCPQGREWSGHGAQVVVAPPSASPPASTSGTAYVAARRERVRLADGSLPMAWWLLGRRDFRAVEVSAQDITDEAAALAAFDVLGEAA